MSPSASTLNPMTSNLRSLFLLVAINAATETVAQIAS